MTTKMLAAALAIGLGATGAYAMDDAAMGQGFNMLTGAVYNALNSQGFDTTNINNLTLGEIAEIRQLLSDEMGTNARSRINLILEEAEG